MYFRIMVTLSSTLLIDRKPDINEASTDLTQLYKSIVKSVRDNNKNDVASAFEQSVSENKVSKKSSRSLSIFFSRAKDVQDNIMRLKQVLIDHRKQYLGQLNDPLSMSVEKCNNLDKVRPNCPFLLALL